MFVSRNGILEGRVNSFPKRDLFLSRYERDRVSLLSDGHLLLAFPGITATGKCEGCFFGGREPDKSLRSVLCHLNVLHVTKGLKEVLDGRVLGSLRVHSTQNQNGILYFDRVSVFSFVHLVISVAIPSVFLVLLAFIPFLFTSKVSGPVDIEIDKTSRVSKLFIYLLHVVKYDRVVVCNTNVNVSIKSQ